MSAPLTSLDRPNSYIGRSVPRPNAKRLLAGRGRYVSDLRLPRMLYAAFLRSPHAHAKIISIDAGRATALEGVHLVATGAHLAKSFSPWAGTLGHFKGMIRAPQLPLRLDRVVWAGQAVVAVVAESRAIAEDALELIEVDYEDLPVVVDIDSARDAGGPMINPGSANNTCFRAQLDNGTVDHAFAHSAHVV